MSRFDSGQGLSNKSDDGLCRQRPRGRTVDSKRANILIIDDDPSVREAIDSMLSMNGYVVTLAESGEEGVSRFREGTYAMVLTDLGMPGSSGWDVVSSIKQLGKGVPVVVMTGWPEEIIRQALDPSEVAEFLIKPFDLDRLLDLVGKLAK